MAKENKVKIEVADTADLSAAPDPLPKVGDIVNHVAAKNKIVEASVIAVKNEGRTVAVEVVNGEGEKAKKQVIHLPHRPKEALAGNTWHWPKAVAMLVLLAYLALAIVTPVRAGLPTYKTFSGVGSSTVPASVFMPADPNSQIRVVTIFYSNDNASGQFQISGGTTAYSITYTNPVSTYVSTNIIGTTNGLAVGSWLALQHNGTVYTNAVVTWGNVDTNILALSLTNVAYVVTTGGFGVDPSVGDEIYLMSAFTSWYPGVGTNEVNGDDIFSANFGRPAILLLGPATTITRLSSVSCHYDSAAQP